MINKILGIGVLIIILMYSSCDTGGPTDPVNPTPDYTGNWVKQNKASISIAINNIDGQPANRVLICDQSTNGDGCIPGIMLDEITIQLDDPKYAKLKIESTNNTIRLVSETGVDLNFTGTYESITTWPDGSCGMYNLANNRIGALNNNCIVGEWYTLKTDSVGNQSIIVYKNYYHDGAGELIIPDENKTVSFKWISTNDMKGDILSEYDFSDSEYTDREYAYLCTETGLALGGAESYIRRNVICVF